MRPRWTATSASTAISISRRGRIPGWKRWKLQDSASPYHDWNERITAECYAPNAASRMLDGDNRITEIVNNYAHISFNFGPTLLSWMEDNAPGTYQRSWMRTAKASNASPATARRWPRPTTT